VSTTLTIQDLDEEVEQKLRQQAASHQRSIEAEAREILRTSLESAPPKTANQLLSLAERRARIESAVGIWKDQMDGKTTDEIMRELRGDD
jgi:plasmid stability protein